MGDQPQRDVKKAELSLLKLVFPRIYGEHEVCCIYAISKGAFRLSAHRPFGRFFLALFALYLWLTHQRCQYTSDGV